MPDASSDMPGVPSEAGLPDMTPKELQRYNDRIFTATMAVLLLSLTALCVGFALLGEGGGGEPIDSTHLLLF